MSESLTIVKPTVLVMAGGTGGHIFPGIAVADELVERGWQAHWLGTKERMEADIIPAHGYDISFIDIAGVRNKNWQAKLLMPLNLLRSVWQARKVIKQVQPDVVLGMGGYASGPGGIAAWLTGKPLVLHEQNAVAGMTNRYLAKFATQVLCAFPNAFNANVEHEVVGNPLRKGIGKSPCQAIDNNAEKNSFEDKESQAEQTDEELEKAQPKRILIIGGSLGAQVLNEVVPKAVNKLKNQDIEVWHQTGKGKMSAVVDDYQANETEANGANIETNVCEFIDNVAAAYNWADIVICRAGALTVSELAMAGKPAIFVPLPHAVDDHQTKNAQYLVNNGAAKIIPQSELTASALALLLESLFAEPETLTLMAKAALASAEKQATKKVADICEQLAH